MRLTANEVGVLKPLGGSNPLVSALSELNSIKRPMIEPIDLLNPVRVALFEPDSKINRHSTIHATRLNRRLFGNLGS